MSKIYRTGGVGAMLDEYERASYELLALLQQIPDEDYERIRDTHTTDENCRSFQTIASHVVSAGYGYADSIRQQLGIPSQRPEKRLLTRDQALSEMRTMLQYTAETLAGKWEMSDEQIQAIQMPTRWGPTYDLEQLMEHAIVHVLRHRRQLEKFLSLPEVRK